MDHVPAPPLHYRSFGPLSTHDVLSSTSMATALQTAGTSAIEWLAANFANATIGSLLDRSRQFAVETGLITDPSVRDAIEDVRSAGGSATMIMLGHAVLSTIPVGSAGDWTPCRIDPRGTRLLG
jgi:pantoate kinase